MIRLALFLPALAGLALSVPGMAQKQFVSVATAGAQQAALLQTPSGLIDGSFESLSTFFAPGVYEGEFPWIGNWKLGPDSGVWHESVDLPINTLPSSPPPSYGEDENGEWRAYLRKDGYMHAIIGESPGVYRLRLNVEIPGNNGGSAPSISVLVDGRPVHTTGALSTGSSVIETQGFYLEEVPIVAAGQDPRFHWVGVEGNSASGGTVILDDLIIERWSAWNEAETWGEPSAGFVPPGVLDDVMIQGGSTVYLDGECNAQVLEVNGELLAPQPAAPQTVPEYAAGTPAESVPLVLAAERITISKDPLPGASSAVLGAGSEAVPFLGELLIYLRRDDQTTEHLEAGRQFLMAMNGGVLDLHGTERTSWTHLVETPMKGENSILVEDSFGWEVGDLIVVAGSEGQRQDTEGANVPPNTHNPEQIDFAESFTIKSIATEYKVDPNGSGPQDLIECSRIHLGELDDPEVSKNILELHLGVDPRVVDPAGKAVAEDLRAEVANLTRNIKIRGEAYNFNESGLGATSGHVMVMWEDCCLESGEAYLENVEFDHLGQSGVVGRYPMHWHMVRQFGAGQYMRGCSVHHAFNRGITIHGTADVEVTDNALYSIMGHSVFLEDGSERGNILRRNLVVSMHRPLKDEQTSLTDNQLYDGRNRCPAAFWITNPDNIVEDNVAAGYIGTGFWLIFPNGVLGRSGQLGYPSALYDPSKEELGSFRGNKAHGLSMGFDIHDRINQTIEMEKPVHRVFPNFPYAPTSGLAEIVDFSTYACQTGIYTGIAPRSVVFQGCYVSECELALRFASYDDIEDSVILGDTGHGLYESMPNDPPGVDCSLENCEQGYSAYLTYDGPGTVRDCFLNGFDGPYDSLVRMSSANNKHVNHRFEGLTYGAPQRLLFERTANSASCTGEIPAPDGPRKYSDFWGVVLHDVDGSLAGQYTSVVLPGDLSIVPTHEMLNVPSDNVIDLQDGGANTFARAMDRHFTLLEVGYEDGYLGSEGEHGGIDVLYHRTGGAITGQVEACNRQESTNDWQFLHMPIATTGFGEPVFKRIVYEVDMDLLDDTQFVPKDLNLHEFRVELSDGFALERADVIVRGIQEVVAAGPADQPVITVTTSDPSQSIVPYPDAAGFADHMDPTISAVYYDSFADELHILGVFPAGAEPKGSFIEILLDW